MNVPIHSNDWEMLSAYLDGQMTESEQRRVRDLLVRSAELRSGLEELRHMRAVLRAAPRQRVPHNFTLTPAMAQKARPHFLWSWAPSLGVASALATVLLVLTFFFQLSPAGMAALSMPAAAPQNAQDRSAPKKNAPPIIIWNDAGNGSSPAGAGGLVSAAAPDFATQSTPPDLAAPAPSISQPMATKAPAAATAPAGAAPRTAIIQPTAIPTQGLKSASQAAPNAEVPTNSSPILGISPTEERGKMLVPTLANLESYGVRDVNPADVSGFSPVQIALAAIAVLTGLAAGMLWWRSRS